MSVRKQCIGLLLDYITSEYSENLTRGVQTYCQENDIDLLLFPIGVLKNETIDLYGYQNSAITAFLTKNNLDGIIVNSGTQHYLTKSATISYFKHFAPLKIVNIAEPLPKTPSIVVDCTQAFDSMLQYLIDVQGCRKFGFMGVDSHCFDVEARTAVFKNVMKRNNIPSSDITVWKSNFEYSSAYHILYDYYKEHPETKLDAIVALNDDMAFACMDYCSKQLHLSIPNDIIITGFDNMQRASFTRPSLTTVDQQVEYAGYTAAQTLHFMLRGKEVPFVKQIKAKAILRNSSAKNKQAQLKITGNSYITVDNRKKEDVSNDFSISEWYDKRSQLFQAANFYTNLETNISIDKLGPLLTSQLRSFGFQAAAVLVYDKPIEMTKDFDFFKLPDKIKLISGLDYESGFNTLKTNETITYNPNEELIPRKLFKATFRGVYIFSLYHHQLQYGFLLLRTNNYDNAVYEILQRSISNQIFTSLNYTKMLKEKSKIQKQNKKLDLIANTDVLTGLRNRRGFMEIGESALELAEKMETSGLVVFCDMDGLKKINDNYGHEAGDTAIAEQGRILKHCFRTNDVLARLGGDEFAIVCSGLTEEKIEKIKEHIGRECDRWTEANPLGFRLSISVGFAKFPLEGSKDSYNLDKLLALADKKLYLEKKAKKAKKGN